MVGRRSGELMPLEVALLGAVVDLTGAGAEPYGFLLARRVADGSPSALTAHGTLYKALARLVAGGLLESRWEDPEAAEEASRPRRRLYRITGAGTVALAAARASAPAAARTSVRTRLA